MTRVGAIVTIAIVLLSGCAVDSSKDVWYIVSDRYASMVIADSEHEFVLFAYMPIGTLRAYRGKLLKEGVVSDDLGALQSLFGFEGDHYVLFNEDVAGKIYQNTSLSFEERVNYLQEGREDLSKTVNVDTLHSLGVRETSADDMAALYALTCQENMTLRFYDIGLFFEQNGKISLLQRNLHQWSERAIEEIEKGTKIHD